jgi:hypothetical protein
MTNLMILNLPRDKVIGQSGALTMDDWPGGLLWAVCNMEVLRPRFKADIKHVSV